MSAMSAVSLAIRGGHFMRLKLTQPPHYRTGKLPSKSVPLVEKLADVAIKSAQIESCAKATRRLRGQK